ncbi:endonuclease/exonuclease/phosphatase family protein [Gilvibacter sp.]|uniref:endonuclease/exonuclease/phosphatase family protein n=1 Tax=Gilvibacter sp. TaxID=2729997 RepID=UPI0035BE6B8F
MTTNLAHITLALASILCVFSYLPLVPSRHWFFRLSDFIRLQLLALPILLFLVLLLFAFKAWSSTILFGLVAIGATIIYQLRVVAPYFSKGSSTAASEGIRLLSLNVMQRNNSYQKVLDLVERLAPDIVLLMETDSNWDKAMESLEKTHPQHIKIPKDNKYGMQCYTRLEMVQGEAKYLISEEHPSVRMELRTANGSGFCFWGIHPPPPSPTEKPTAKQKDAELLKLAALLADSNCPTLVAGDFNVVCWSQISKRFAALSKLTDARIGRGFFSTFPARSPLLRFPLDLLFHSKGIRINQLRVLKPVDSDHLPLFTAFEIQEHAQKEKESLNSEERQEVQETVVAGKAAAQKEN